MLLFGSELTKLVIPAANLTKAVAITQPVGHVVSSAVATNMVATGTTAAATTGITAAIVPLIPIIIVVTVAAVVLLSDD